MKILSYLDKEPEFKYSKAWVMALISKWRSYLSWDARLL